jgi:hypothetical protein
MQRHIQQCRDAKRPFEVSLMATPSHIQLGFSSMPEFFVKYLTLQNGKVLRSVLHRSQDAAQDIQFLTVGAAPG